MIKTFSVYKQKITKLTYVHSEDVFRFEKVEQLRNGHFDVIFTTTILERGFTMANLDVVVIDAHQYTSRGFNTNCWTCWTKIRMSHWKSIVFP